MAMSKCKECGKAVSTLAKTCPNCGVPKPAKKLKKITKSSKSAKPNPGRSVKRDRNENFIIKRVKHFKGGLNENQLKEVDRQISENKEFYKKIWAHCSNKKCGDYTQMYQIPNLALAKRVCIKCASHLKKAQIIDHRPVMPTDGTYERQATNHSMSHSDKKVSNSTQTTSGKKGTWETFLDGNLDLATSFWGFLVVGTFVVGFVCGWLSAAYGMGWMIPLVIYTFIAVGGTWASAENYKKKQLSKQQSVLWGILAQIVCVLNVISIIATIVDMF